MRPVRYPTLLAVFLVISAQACRPSVTPVSGSGRPRSICWLGSPNAIDPAPATIVDVEVLEVKSPQVVAGVDGVSKVWETPVEVRTLETLQGKASSLIGLDGVALSSGATLSPSSEPAVRDAATLRSGQRLWLFVRNTSRGAAVGQQGVFWQVGDRMFNSSRYVEGISVADFRREVKEIAGGACLAAEQSAPVELPDAGVSTDPEGAPATTDAG